jgi:hypothetical protein
MPKLPCDFRPGFFSTPAPTAAPFTAALPAFGATLNLLAAFANIAARPVACTSAVLTVDAATAAAAAVATLDDTAVLLESRRSVFSRHISLGSESTGATFDEPYRRAMPPTQASTAGCRNVYLTLDCTFNLTTTVP